jgi:hypothetical protein
VLCCDAGGTILGAVGISGDVSAQDEVCAVAGIQAAGLRPDTATGVIRPRPGANRAVGAGGVRRNAADPE